MEYFNALELRIDLELDADILVILKQCCEIPGIRGLPDRSMQGRSRDKIQTVYGLMSDLYS